LEALASFTVSLIVTPMLFGRLCRCAPTLLSYDDGDDAALEPAA
jgi:hypothetical protein